MAIRCSFGDVSMHEEFMASVAGEFIRTCAVHWVGCDKTNETNSDMVTIISKHSRRIVFT